MKNIFLALSVMVSMGVLASGAVERRFKLPPETAKLKPGAGVEQATSNCLLCHSADYISTQPPLDRAGWLGEVNKMREKFGAPIPTNRVDALVDYFTNNYGKADPKK